MTDLGKVLVFLELPCWFWDYCSWRLAGLTCH